MLIRCERCSTTYELEETLLAPEGSPVQCTRCQHVFTARPSTAPGQTTLGVAPPPAPEPRPPPPESRPAPRPSPPAEQSPQGPSEEPSRERSASGNAGLRRPIGDRPRPAGQGPAVYRPSPGHATATPVARPSVRKDRAGAFESRLKWSARLRWLVPLVALLVLVGAGVAWWLGAPGALLSRTDPEVDRIRAEASRALARDDVRSLDQAIAQLDGAARKFPGAPGLAADRAHAQAIRAAGVVEEGEVLATRAQARRAEQERIRAVQAAGWEEAARAEGAAADALSQASRDREAQARSLGGAAFETLKQLERDSKAAPEAARGLVAYHALGADRGPVEKAAAGGADPASNPWTALALAAVDLREKSPAALERAAASLGGVAAAHPELLRARYLLARAQAALGRREEALATLEGVTAANPAHEGARALREELNRAAPPPVAPPPPPPPVAAKPAPLPRKPIAQPPPAAAPSAAPAAPAAAAPGPAPVPEQPAPAPPNPAAAGSGSGTPAPAPTPARPPARPRGPDGEPAAEFGGG